jgi:aspartate--ammonia ligase
LEAKDMGYELTIPKDYRPALSVLEIEEAIKAIKDRFQRDLAEALELVRVTAPLFVRSGSGINDDLNGVERPVRFTVSANDHEELEIVQSLAKWKRLAIARYGIDEGRGLYTDMNAIRPDEVLDNLHSIYVDQWDWEKRISPEDRTVETLIGAVRSIYDVVRRTEFFVASEFGDIRPVLPEGITVISAEELAERYPDLAPGDREDMIAREHGAVFILGIGADLADGRPHDGRAPDYDDWISERPDGGRGLNGDIILWHPVLGRAFEISSMGIRVDAGCLRQQLARRGAEERMELEFHRKLLDGELPQTMGGGIGQSRLCMFFLRTAHVGEVAVGVWPPEMEEACAAANIFLL